MFGNDMDTKGLRKGMTSHNVANDGNFSIQVIERALLQFDNVACVPLAKKEVQNSIQDYALEHAFICNSKDHWLAIRKVHGVWYNLNSTNIVPPGPQIISTFYLSAFLDSIMQTGYTIFVVRPSKGKDLPQPNTRAFDNQYQKEGQMFCKTSDLQKYHNEHKNDKLNVSGQDERELEQALQKSLKDMDGNSGAAEKKPESPKFKAFTGKGFSLNDGASSQAGVDTNSELYQTLAAEYGDDPEMIAGIIESMKMDQVSKLEVPVEPSSDAEGVVNLQLRLPDGSKLTRRFLRSNTIGHVINFVKKERQNYTTVKIVTSFPKRVLESESMTLEEAKFGKNEAVNVDAI